MNFHERVRALLEERRMTVARLATTAGLDPSLLSRLLTSDAASRREPRLEHVLAIARALEMDPMELVAGTNAQGVLDEWVPRTELQAEIAARIAAQAEAARSRTELAGREAEVAALNATIGQIMQRVTETEVALHRERLFGATARAERDAAVGRRDAALVERDSALEQAARNYQAWANAVSQVRQLDRATRQAKASASAGWTLLIGGVAAAILGSEASPPKKRTTSTRRTRRK